MLPGFLHIFMSACLTRWLRREELCPPPAQESVESILPSPGTPLTAFHGFPCLTYWHDGDSTTHHDIWLGQDPAAKALLII